jgi:SET domain-containing protein
VSATVTGPSAIAGTGLFAAEPIPAGAVVWLALETDEPSEINHSCDPNLWWLDGVTLGARRDIAAGEELTYDYATSIDDPDYMLRCHCETYRCRQMVTGDDRQVPELQRRYAGHWRIPLG